MRIGPKAFVISLVAGFGLAAGIPRLLERVGHGAPPKLEFQDVPTAVAYCLDEPNSGELKIMSAQTGDLMYRAARPSGPGTATVLREFNGEASPDGASIGLTGEACQVDHGRGPIVNYARISSPLGAAPVVR